MTVYCGEYRIASEPMFAVRKHWQCPSCMSGEMIYTGISQLIAPPNYEHKCNNPRCLVIWYSKKKYPCIEFVPVPAMLGAANDSGAPNENANSPAAKHPQER